MTFKKTSEKKNHNPFIDNAESASKKPYIEVGMVESQVKKWGDPG
jgi:hypothetical protein